MSWKKEFSFVLVPIKIEKLFRKKIYEGHGKRGERKTFQIWANFTIFLLSNTTVN
jgi:hypothetical protein